MYETTLWVAEGFLALFFLFAGLPKIVGRGIDRWVGFDQVPRGVTVVIGACELAGAVALVAPVLAHRAQWTTPLAALGLAVLSLMASGFHARNHEWVNALETMLWAALCGVISVARFGELATGPTISVHSVLPAVLLVLVPAIVVLLVVLTRVTAPSRRTQSR